MFLRVEYVRGGTYSFFLVNKMTNIPVRVLVGALKQEEDVKKPVASACMITNKACILYKPEILGKYLMSPIEDWLKKKPVWCDYDEYIIRNT